MKKAFQKILLLVAVCTITAHNIFPHFHFADMISMVQDDHHHDENGHHTNESDVPNPDDHDNNPFSFAQLDDEFLPAKESSDKTEVPLQFLPALLFQPVTQRFSIYIKPQCGWYIEYPPPDGYLKRLPARAPPASSFS